MRNVLRLKFYKVLWLNYIYTMLKFFLLSVCLLVVSQVFPQRPGKAVKFYDESKKAFYSGDKTRAIQLANQAVLYDSTLCEAHLLLADLYHDADSAGKEILHLNSALINGSKNTAQIYYRLGSAHFSFGNYENALSCYERCRQAEGTNHKWQPDIDDKSERCRFAMEAQKNPASEPVFPMPGNINSLNDDYWPSITIDGEMLVFTRLIKPGSQSRFAQEDFYSSRPDSNGWAAAKPIAEINTPENEGAQSVSADGKLLFFTACNRNDGFGSCDIYFSRLKDGQWTIPANAGAPLNTMAWESQPSVSANADYLYFASNRPGGKGQKDIWRCALNGFSSSGMPIWGKPENLGSSINTAGNELSPFIHFNDSLLYFVSDKWIGMGKNDVFFSKIINDTAWSKPENLGWPVNSNYDEQGFIVDATGRTAYFASNRIKTQGYDIFTATLDVGIRPSPVTYLKGRVSDAETNLPLQAPLSLINLKKLTLVKNNILADENGEFTLCLPLGSDYAFNVSKPGYLFYSASFNLSEARGISDPFLAEIKLQPVKTGNSMVLRNLYFEFDSYEFLPESLPELEKLFAFLNENPALSVEIGGHTDNTGSSAYNQALSEKRAEAVVKYLVEKGIPASKMSFKGYGFSKPVAPNDTEEGKQQNRRTEITVTGCK